MRATSAEESYERALLQRARATAELARAQLLDGEAKFVATTLKRALITSGLDQQEPFVAQATRCAYTENTYSHHGWW